MNKIELIEQQILGCILLDGRFILHGKQDKLDSLTWRYKTHAYIYCAIMKCLEKYESIDAALVFIMQEGEKFSFEHLLELTQSCAISSFDDYLDAHKTLVAELT